MTDEEIAARLDAILAIEDNDLKSFAFLEFYEEFKQNPDCLNAELRAEINAFAERLQAAEDEIDRTHAAYVMADAALHEYVTRLDEDYPGIRKDLLYWAAHPEDERHEVALKMAEMLWNKEHADGTFDPAAWGIEEDDDD